MNFYITIRVPPLEGPCTKLRLQSCSLGCRIKERNGETQREVEELEKQLQTAKMRETETLKALVREVETLKVKLLEATASTQVCQMSKMTLVYPYSIRQMGAVRRG